MSELHELTDDALLDRLAFRYGFTPAARQELGRRLSAGRHAIARAAKAEASAAELLALVPADLLPPEAPPTPVARDYRSKWE
jgi:hypothetical protein